MCATATYRLLPMAGVNVPVFKFLRLFLKPSFLTPYLPLLIYFDAVMTESTTPPQTEDSLCFYTSRDHTVSYRILLFISS